MATCPKCGCRLRAITSALPDGTVATIAEATELSAKELVAHKIPVYYWHVRRVREMLRTGELMDRILEEYS